MDRNLQSNEIDAKSQLLVTHILLNILLWFFDGTRVLQPFQLLMTIENLFTCYNM